MLSEVNRELARSLIPISGYMLCQTNNIIILLFVWHNNILCYTYHMNTCLKCKITIQSDAVYGLHRYCFTEWFGQIDANEFTELDPKRSSSTPRSYPEIKKQKNTFFHGNYLKYSARLGKTDYILKVQEPGYPELPLVEYLCNQIAELLKIDIPPYYLINFNGRTAFVTRNFMQDYTGTLHHIYKYIPAGEENYNCEEIINVILTQTGKLAEVVKFIGICLFDALIGNNDRHGRNLGIIETASSKKLAPMYDNPSCLGIEEDFFLMADINPSGSIWTKTSRQPKPVDYIEEFQRLGHEAIVKKFCSKVVLQSGNIIKTIKHAELTQLRKDALTKLFQKRMGGFERVN